MMSGRSLAILLFLLAHAEAKLVILDEADLLLKRFEKRLKLINRVIIKESNF